jgi:predicted DNA-binding protein
MDQDLAERLDVLSSVVGMSKNAVVVAAIKTLLLDYEEDPNYRELRSSWAEQMELEAT